MSAVKEKLVTYEEKLAAQEQQFREKSEILMQYGKAIKEDEANIKALKVELTQLEADKKAVQSSVAKVYKDIKGIIETAEERADNIIKKARIKEDEADARRDSLLKQNEELDKRIDAMKQEDAVLGDKSKRITGEIKRLIDLEKDLKDQKRDYDDKLEDLISESARVAKKEDMITLRENNIVSEEARIASSNSLLDKKAKEIDLIARRVDEKSQMLQIDILQIAKQQEEAIDKIIELQAEEDRIRPLIDLNEKQLAEIVAGKKNLAGEQKGLENERRQVQYRELRVRRIIQDKEIDEALLEDKRNQ